MSKKKQTMHFATEIRKTAIAVITSILTLVLGFIISDISFHWRENFRKGLIQFEIDDHMSQKISAVFESNDENISKIYEIKNSSKYYFEPGEYKYSLFIGQYLIAESSVRIEPRKLERVIIDRIPLPIFHFIINIDREVYGPGDAILATLFSTKDSWIYLFHYDGNSFQQLNQSAIFLTAFDPLMIDRITANSYPSEDNIIGIALLEKNRELLDTALSNLSRRRKSDYSDPDTPWKSDWISFLVK